MRCVTFSDRLLHGAALAVERVAALLEGELRRLDALLATEKRNADAICDVLAACEPGHQKAHDRLADLEATRERAAEVLVGLDRGEL